MQQNSITPTAVLQQLADNGDAQAQFDLAYRYGCGIGVVPDLEQAMSWLNQPAEQGLVEAQLFLGLHHATLNGLWSLFFSEIKEYQLIYNWVTTKKQGFTEPDDNLYRDLESCFSSESSLREQKASAFNWFSKAAEQGCAEAQYWLARCYVSGLGCEQSDKLALDWFKKAAEQGFAEAYYYLACCYRDGKGVEQNQHLAFEWITKAVELADAYFSEATIRTKYCSQVAEVYYFLGDLYAQGKGITQNDDQAFKFYKLAANRGVTQAYLLVGNLASQGKGCEKNEKLAFKAYKCAYELDMDNRGEAAYRLALCYEEGKGTDVDITLAIELIETAVSLGNFEAKKNKIKMLMRLATDFHNGKKGYEIDYKEAIKYASLAAELGSISSYLMLGTCYADGKGVEKNDELAFEYFKKAIEQNDNVDDEEQARYSKNLAHLYLSISYAQGKGIDKNEALAAQHYQFVDFGGIDKLCEVGILTAKPKSHGIKEILPFKLAVFDVAEEYDLAREFVETVFENVNGIEASYKSICMTSIENAQKLQKKAQELRQAQVELQEKNQQLQQAQKELEDMMSMFAHKFRSPLDAIIYNTTHENQVKLYTEAAQTMRGLLNIFSIISTDAEILKEKIKQDRLGNGRLAEVFSKTLDMILLHLLSVSGAEKIQQHYMAYAKVQGLCDTEISYKTWCEDYFELEQKLQSEWEQSFALLLNQSATLEQRRAWLEQHFFKLELIGFERADIQFKEYGVTESLLTILLNEILVNAFKYYSSASKQPVVLEWTEREGYQVLICRNPSIRSERTMLKGSGKGHTFLSALARKTDSQFSKPKPQDDFVLEFGIANELLMANPEGEL